MKSARTEIHTTNFEGWTTGVRFFDAVGAKHKVPWLRFLFRTEWETNFTGPMYSTPRISLMQGTLYWFMKYAEILGKVDEIAVAQVSSRAAVRMFLEGLLTMDHLYIAVNYDTHVEMTPVQLEGRHMVVRVVPSGPSLTFLDRQDNIIELPEE
ncbi:MAG TPA: hypothetical protein VK694_08190 [Verrucomicrobiae bacterium]|nr:hypothetical protein [Verrucomicrobiae bacterium]